MEEERDGDSNREASYASKMEESIQASGSQTDKEDDQGIRTELKL